MAWHALRLRRLPVRRHYGIAFRGTYPDSGSGSEISRLLSPSSHRSTASHTRFVFHFGFGREQQASCVVRRHLPRLAPIVSPNSKSESSQSPSKQRRDSQAKTKTKTGVHPYRPGLLFLSLPSVPRKETNVRPRITHILSTPGPSSASVCVHALTQGRTRVR